MVYLWHIPYLVDLTSFQVVGSFLPFLLGKASHRNSDVVGPLLPRVSCRYHKAQIGLGGEWQLHLLLGPFPCMELLGCQEMLSCCSQEGY